LRGEIGYVRGEQFSLQSGVNWYGFNKQVTEDRAWGMLPFELNAHLRWRVVKDLWLTADAYLWEGALFRTNTGQATRVDGAFDLNAGLEFRVAKRLTIWTRFNNITNTNYQRWNQYEAYGFNMMGGVSFQFDK
jgi:outer membrane receptor protein involved in Fe transport